MSGVKSRQWGAVLVFPLSELDFEGFYSVIQFSNSPCGDWGKV